MCRSHKKNKKLHTPHKPTRINPTSSCGGCSRPLYSSHTTPHTTINNHRVNHSCMSQIWCEHQDQPTKMDCCPRHPTVCQRNNLEKDCLYMCLKRFCYRSLRPAVCFHSDSTNSGMTTLGSSTTNPTNLKKLLKMRVKK